MLPVVCDALAHTFWKMQHIATVHYENGKYHLHVELQQEHSSDSTGALPSEPNESLFVHLGINSVSEFLFTDTSREYSIFRYNLISFSLEKDILPPKV